MFLILRFVGKTQIILEAEFFREYFCAALLKLFIPTGFDIRTSPEIVIEIDQDNVPSLIPTATA